MKRVLMGLAAGLLLVASVSSQPYGPGPGMMGGGYAGPGMMGGYGMGSGMMGGFGGYGMGPGMMGGGYPMGPGMMGGYGPGCNVGGPDFTPEQREKIAALQNESSQRQWALMQKMQEQDMRAGRGDPGGKFDEQASRKSYEAMAEVRKQMFENSLESRKKFDAILTPQQREQMRRGFPGR